MSAILTNRFLFSHHYLERIYQEADDKTEAAQLVADLRGWASGWDDSSLSSLIGTQVGPTLVSLGFNYQDPSDGEDPHLVRLYTSYRKENQVGLCYVAHRQDGEADLDSTIKGRHYAAQIIHALKEEELSWGLLTDGERWRLYHADELAPYETFLEIDLGQLLRDRGGAGRGDTAYLLHTLFTKSAFEVDEDGECALDRHLTASEKEASAIEKHLSTCIEDVLRDLCQGFVERDGRETYTSDQRDEVFRNATVLLYRLLFILYAEARDLLPLEVPEYHSASLDALVEQAAQYVKVTGLPNPDGTDLWQDLNDLCSWINSGDEDHQIPAYNGDLFDDSDKQYIHDHAIADKYLAPALFSLGAIEDDSESGYRRIDYRDLSVRHLGSIYEGLLEYKLFIAQERRVRRSDDKGGYTFPKLSDTRLKKGEEDQIIQVGEVYFADSAGERKAMGAYYTPEYIVDYIVQQTVRRGLEERRASLEEQLPAWLEEVETAPPGERHRLQKVVDEKLLDFVEQEVLTFRVCDPAMGSGHFLVNAVHTITTFIVETLNLTPWMNAEIDSDPVKWRRRVAKRCLYGVDLNALAVELAKLSLWLTTVAKGKPLSFLDHHLRQGNSLIGTRLVDLIGLLDERTDRAEDELSAGQISMFDAYSGFRAPLKGAKRLLRRISARVADATKDVESQMADYEQVRRELKPYRDLANLVTAQHFGLNVDDDQLHTIAHCLLEDTSRCSEDDRTLLARAREQARSRSFFHWDLEFPEVFVHLDRAAVTEDRGFDAMVGNPPWDVLIDLRGRPELRQELDWYRTSDRYAKHLAGGRKNIYWFFCMLGVSLLGKTGRFSMIVPVTLLTDSTTRGLRKLFIEDHSLKRLVQFPEAANVFGKVSQSCSIFVVSRGTSSEEPIQVALGVTSEQLDDLTFHSLSPDVIRRSSGEMLAIPMFLSEMVPTVLERIHKWDSLESSMVVYQGEANQTFDSEYFLVQPSGTRLIRGTHVQKYEVLPPTRGNPDWIDASSFLQAASGFKKRMVQRTRVVTQGISNMALPDRLKAVVVEPGSVVGNSCNALVEKNAAAQVELTYVMALLNSTLLEWRYRLFSSNNNINTYELEALPLRRIASTTSEPTLLALADQGRQLCNESLNDGDPDGALDFADQQLRAEPSRSDVVQRMLVYLADRAVQLRGRERDLDKQVDVFEYVGTDQPVLRLEKAFVLTKRRRANDALNLEAVHHDIDGLHLVPNKDGTWTLELYAKLRDPDQGWQDWIKEEDSHMIKRQWVPAYQLQMSEEKARFYRYALPRLQDFDNASSFPGGYTRSTLKKLHLTKVPMMPDVDLSDLARLDQELTETKRKIELTDDLIDQIVYKLYGLTEKEIAIVEGQT